MVSKLVIQGTRGGRERSIQELY